MKLRYGNLELMPTTRMVERVHVAWEAEHPGQHLSVEELTRRIYDEIRACVRVNGMVPHELR